MGAGRVGNDEILIMKTLKCIKLLLPHAGCLRLHSRWMQMYTLSEIMAQNRKRGHQKSMVRGIV